MFRILVVEDDFPLQKLICTVLTKNQYETLTASNGLEALELLDKEYIDLVITDVMMPKMNGFDLIRELRSSGYSLPIMIITAKNSFPDKQTGFKLGVDDYMVKPVDVKEMVLRVEALLRRAKIISQKELNFGSVNLNYNSLSVTVDGHTEILPQKEFYVLFKLLAFPGQSFTRQQLMDELWGYETESDIRTVDVHINRLRDRYRDAKDFKIETIRGLGYRAVITAEEKG